MIRLARVLGMLLAALLMLAVIGWGSLVFFYLLPASETTRSAAAVGFALVGCALAAVLLAPRTQAVTRWRVAAAFAGMCALALLVWGSAVPSNDREWRTEVAQLPYATIDGNLVTVHNIRNFDYRTEHDFTPAYYDRTFDLQRLDRVDLIAVYWMGPAIAHMFVSFGFGDVHLPISIEVRRERNEQYSTLAGFFRQYELYYVVADERDVIRLRTNYRSSPPEDVYIFRVKAPIENTRRVFLDYMQDINRLRTQPRFYNTLTTNCTTLILTHASVNPDHARFTWKVLLSGYAPEYAYEVGRLDTSRPFEELMRYAHVNARARAADADPDFSRRIRADIP